MRLSKLLFHFVIFAVLLTTDNSVSAGNHIAHIDNSTITTTNFIVSAFSASCVCSKNPYWTIYTSASELGKQPDDIDLAIDSDLPLPVASSIVHRIITSDWSGVVFNIEVDSNSPANQTLTNKIITYKEPSLMDHPEYYELIACLRRSMKHPYQAQRFRVSIENI
jgi:hypothetical protein